MSDCVKYDSDGITAQRPTGSLLMLWLRETNPVTKAVYAEIIGDRIDRALAHQKHGH